MAAKSFSSCEISRFSSDCKSKFVEGCSSSISSARCELNELSDVSKILLELAVTTTSLIFSLKLRDTVAMRGTGGDRLRGKASRLRFQAKTEGTTPFLKETHSFSVKVSN